jgi:hypothetical protein
MLRYAILGLAVTAAGCTDLRTQMTPDVRVATADEVVDCTPIKIIRATPGVFGPLLEQGLADARKQILLSAARDDADAVVFDDPPAGGEVFELQATAYRCPEPI